MARLFAFLAGIDQYPNPAHRLRGCVNDAEALREFLNLVVKSPALDVITELRTDAQATRAEIVAGFKNHLAQAGPGDTALFFYAGHGSQQAAPPEFWTVDPDRLNETLVCWDSRTEGSWDLADKELAALIRQIAASAGHVAILLDCCHSGSGTRELLADGVERRVPLDPRQRPMSSLLLEAQPVPPASARVASGWQMAAGGRHVLMAACRDNQTAKEYNAGGKRHGVFTHFLLDTLRAAKGPLTYHELYQRVAVNVSAQFNSQSPQLEASAAADLDLPFLNVVGQSRSAVYSASHIAGRGWVLDAGRVHGIPPSHGDESLRVALHELAAKTEDLRSLKKALATAHATETLTTDTALAMDPPAALDTKLTYKAVITALPLPPLAVKLDGDADGVALVRTAIETGDEGRPSPYVREAPAEARYRLLASNHTYRITAANDDRLLVEHVVGYDSINAGRVLALLEHISKWVTIAELKSNAVDLSESGVSLTLLKSIEPEVPLEAGEVRLHYRKEGAKWMRPAVYIKVTNNSNRTLHCALLGLTELFGVDAAFLAEGAKEVPPGGSFYARDGQPAYFTVPADQQKQGATQARDVIKLIASTAPFNPRLMAQAELQGPTVRALDAAVDRTPKGKGTLERLMKRVQVRGFAEEAEEVDAETADGFLTKAAVITTVRPREGASVVGSRDADLGFGVRVLPHPTLRATARLTSVQQVSRDLGPHLLPPTFRQERQVEDGYPPPETLQFSESRGTDPGLSILELAPAAGAEINYQAVTPAQPLLIRIDQPIGDGEFVLPIGYEGEFYIPLGRAKADGGGMVVELSRLPHPVENQDRSLLGSIRILFQKFVAKPLGLGYDYPILATAAQDPNGKAVYDKDMDHVRARVAAATQVVVFVHGIIGDTLGMAPCLHVNRPDIAILAFDYENLHTTIEQTAAHLKQRLQEAGLGPGHGKKLQLAAHSMGGLVSRHFIERLDGAKSVSELVMLGTPNAGSPWSTVEDWVTSAAALVINGLTSVAWPVQLLGGLFGVVEKIDNTLDQMKPGSAFLKDLAKAPDPRIPYTLLAGDTSLIDRERAKKIKQLMNTVLSLAFLNHPNDLAVAVESINAIPGTRMPAPRRVPVACDHLSYFHDSASVAALKQALGIA